MTRIDVSDETLVVTVLALDVLWALKREVRVPLAHLRGAEVAVGALLSRAPGIRALGTWLPGVVTAGTYSTRGGREFWNVYAGGRAIVLSLRGDRYARIVIDVEDAESDVACIRSALAARAPGV